MDNYLDEHASEIRRRTLAKVTASGVAGGTAAAVAGLVSGRHYGRGIPAVAVNCAAAMSALCVCQETVRWGRGGQHDAWTSFVAGGITGSALVAYTGGRKFGLLGAVVWAPLCGLTHWLHDAVQPGQHLQTLLAEVGLVDPPPPGAVTLEAAAAAAGANMAAAAATGVAGGPGQGEGQISLQQAAAGGAMGGAAASVSDRHPESEGLESSRPAPRTLESLSKRELRQFAEEIKQRELEVLHAQWRQEEAARQQAAAAAVAAQYQQRQQLLQAQRQGEGEDAQVQQPRRAWWRLW